MGVLEWSSKAISRTLRAVSAKESAHTAHAIQEARRLVPPTSRPCSLAPSVTSPLYSATVSQTLRQTLRASFSERRSAELLKIISYEAKQYMLASLNSAADFSMGCAHQAMQPP